MKIPNLMPFQMEPFNGDKFIEKEFLKLKDKFSTTTAVETGTCLGSTSLWLSKNFNRVITVESSLEYLTIAHERFKYMECKNIKTELGDSGQILYALIVENDLLSDNIIFFLDAHWMDACPLHDELHSIYHAGIKPVIAIHDFKVPNEPTLGYDSYNKRDFDFAFIQPELELIYGEEGYDYHYNNSSEAMGAMRGIIYIYPKL